MISFCCYFGWEDIVISQFHLFHACNFVRNVVDVDYIDVPWAYLLAFNSMPLVKPGEIFLENIQVQNPWISALYSGICSTKRNVCPWWDNCLMMLGLSALNQVLDMRQLSFPRLPTPKYLHRTTHCGCKFQNGKDVHQLLGWLVAAHQEGIALCPSRILLLLDLHCHQEIQFSGDWKHTGMHRLKYKEVRRWMGFAGFNWTSKFISILIPMWFFFLLRAILDWFESGEVRNKWWQLQISC